MSRLQAILERYRVSADPLRTQRRIELVAIALGLLLCLQLAFFGVRLATLRAPEPLAPAADSMRVPLVLSPDTVAADERGEIVARPLFWSSRRPASTGEDEEEPPPVAGAGPLRDVKQVGIFGSGDDAGIIALVKGKKRRILLGETVNGWTLESIRSTESQFSNGERSETLTLEPGKVKTTPNPAVKYVMPSGTARKSLTPIVGAPGTRPVQPQSGSPGKTGAAPGAKSKADDEPGLGLGQSGWRQPASE